MKLYTLMGRYEREREGYVKSLGLRAPGSERFPLVVVHYNDFCTPSAYLAYLDRQHYNVKA